MAILFGTSGNNTITGAADADFILGYDPVVPSPDGNDTLSGGGGNDSIYGGDGNDIINGDAGADRLFGGNGNDSINGGTDNDTLTGGAGADSLNGGDGNDILIGGTGVDTMTDGGGNDVYRFLSITDSGVNSGNRDILTDFTGGVDTIDVSAIDANTSSSGDQAFIWRGLVTSGSAPWSGGGEVRYFISGTSAIVQFEIEGDGNLSTDMEIQLTNVSSLAAANFTL